MIINNKYKEIVDNMSYFKYSSLHTFNMIGTFSRKLCPDGLMKLEYSHVIKQEITYMTSLIF